jgi:hypothetical protein
MPSRVPIRKQGQCLGKSRKGELAPKAKFPTHAIPAQEPCHVRLVMFHVRLPEKPTLQVHEGPVMFKVELDGHDTPVCKNFS